jgi:tRNA pseudouridine38-40 synthase
MRYFIELAYKGTHFHGWQRQPDAVSVQEVIENALSTKLQEDIAIVGAGRTDTGVHAEFFVAHFETEMQFHAGKLVYGLNHLVGQEIVIFGIYEVAHDKHARFDALSRTYEYRISTIKNPFYRETSSLFTVELNLDLMNKASEILFDYIDFTSFSKLHTDNKTNNCKITEAFWVKKDGFLTFTITADRFLRNMVRAIVGTLIEVGQNKISLKDFRNIIEAKNRSKAGMSVPPEGLFLTKIEY